MDVKRLISMAVSALAMCCLIINGAANIYYFTKMSENVKNPTIDTSKTNAEDYLTNMDWVTFYTPIMYGVICLVCAVFEIILIVKDFLPMSIGSLFESVLFRAFLYVGVGAMSLSICGELGLSGGILSIIAGAAVLGSGIFVSL